MAADLSPENKKALLQGVVLDGACIAVGVALFLFTGSWIWIVAGAGLGSGFLLPPLISISRSRTSD